MDASGSNHVVVVETVNEPASVVKKRSKWDTDEHEGGQSQVDELERQAMEARAKVAAKAARQRAKAAQRARREAERNDHVATSSSLSRATSSSAGPSTPLRQANSTSMNNLTHSSSRPLPPPVPPRSWHPDIQGCRSIQKYERLNHIEEGSYGVVFRAREKSTGEIVALKKLKMDKEKNGFPITSLREIRTLMEANHENVVRVREIVVGDTLTQ
ncbi:hypothetical protein CBS101457_000367 [Exobasidium rhododendri]|nr:hypothetical protein CBS101457_000367 [Exobasidium rhododendri]